jgi:hypothetical protein
MGTELLSWRDLVVILRQAPRDSAYVRATLGEDAQWGLAEHLLAIGIDVLQLANWQRGNAGRKSLTPKPKPLPRPGVNRDKGRIGHGAIPIKDFDAWWNGELDETAISQEPSPSQPQTQHLSELLADEGWQAA